MSWHTGELEFLSLPAFTSPHHYFILVFRKKEWHHFTRGTKFLSPSHRGRVSSLLASPIRLCYQVESVNGFTVPLRGRAEDISSPTSHKTWKHHLYLKQWWACNQQICFIELSLQIRKILHGFKKQVQCPALAPSAEEGQMLPHALAPCSSVA